MTFEPKRLSAEAFNELRTITKAGLAEPMTDGEIEEMGVRLLQLFSTLSIEEPQPPGIVMTEQDHKALAFLREEIQNGRNPSVRDFARVMGFRSSRSGFRLLARLTKRGWVWRDGQGVLKMRKRSDRNN